MRDIKRERLDQAAKVLKRGAVRIPAAWTDHTVDALVYGACWVRDHGVIDTEGVDVTECKGLPDR